MSEHQTRTERAPSRLLTLPEVAERLRRSESQMRWMRHHGKGPRSAKVAGRVMYREDDVEAWIEEQFAAGDASSVSA